VHLLVAKTDEERRLTLNSIGPIWDGNEVWLVLGGGVLFAAFPPAYASLFSGFYLAFMLVLLVMILRTVAIEFRSKRPGAHWRRTWDTIFALSSLGLALLLGVAFGNIIGGVNLNSSGDIDMSLLDLLSPYPLLIGLTSVSMFALHGLHFLALKTEGEIDKRIGRLIPKVMIAFFVLTTLSVIATDFEQEEVADRFIDDIWPLIFPAAALIAFYLSWRIWKSGNELGSFAASAATIALLLVSGGVGMYPNLLLSSGNSQYSLTVNNSAAASNTLTVMLVVAVIGLPMVLLYTAGVYYFFRGKTELGPDSY
jgi:cytochrome d ubiquinol oxidase subunit II